MLFFAVVSLFSIHPVHNEDAARSLRARVSAEMLLVSPDQISIQNATIPTLIH